MSRMWWIIIFVAAGIGLAVVIGVLGTRNEPSKTETLNTFCDSLTTLEGSIKTLTSLPSSASKAQYQADVDRRSGRLEPGQERRSGSAERADRRSRQRVGQLHGGGQECPERLLGL